jgi:hypothetical protein
MKNARPRQEAGKDNALIIKLRGVLEQKGHNRQSAPGLNRNKKEIL